MSRSVIKDKIIYATIECIEEVGVGKITMRMIAKKASVNPAMLNYYFTSKENLINSAMQTTLKECFINNIEDYAGLWDSDPKKALVNFLSDTLIGAINYPNITKSHFHETLVDNNYDTVPVNALRNLFCQAVRFGKIYTIRR